MMWGFDYAWWPPIGMMVLGIVFWTLFLGLATWAIVRWISRAQTESHPPASSATPPHADALDILRERYAKGEIDASAFEDMCARLDASAQPERPQDADRVVTRA
ncbi:MAG TPA: SHOCT domain-containing protein [Ktedonobacterales bacterium]|nr:SHOCT domain-containing protein [Ktedonobacterales bacterium]